MKTTIAFFVLIASVIEFALYILDPTLFSSKELILRTVVASVVMAVFMMSVFIAMSGLPAITRMKRESEAE